MKTLFIRIPLLIVAPLALLLTGCQTHLIGGTPVSRVATMSLTSGMTYQDVIAELGPPLIKVDEQSAIAYPWDTNRGYFEINNFDKMNLYGYVDPDRGHFTREIHPVYHALCLKFDDQKKLLAWKSFEAQTADARMKAMKAWAAGTFETASQ